MRFMNKTWKSLATVLIVVGLVGGPAYAAGLAKNSVKSKHIKDGQVLTQDIGDGAVGAVDLADDSVTGPKILDGSIGSLDIAAGNITTSKIASDAVDSSKIATGAVGSDAIANGSVTGGLFGGELANGTITSNNLANQAVSDTKLGQLTRRTATTTIPTGNVGQATVSCNAGETAIFAGSDWDVYFGVTLLAANLTGGGGASGAPDTAVVTGHNTSGVNRDLTAQVLCLA